MELICLLGELVSRNQVYLKLKEKVKKVIKVIKVSFNSLAIPSGSCFLCSRFPESNVFFTLQWDDSLIIHKAVWGAWDNYLKRKEMSPLQMEGWPSVSCLTVPRKAGLISLFCLFECDMMPAETGKGVLWAAWLCLERGAFTFPSCAPSWHAGMLHGRADISWAQTIFW